MHLLVKVESYADFDVDQSRNNIAKQLKHQIGYMDPEVININIKKICHLLKNKWLYIYLKQV